MSDNLRHTRYGSLPTGAPPASSDAGDKPIRSVGPTFIPAR